MARDGVTFGLGTTLGFVLPKASMKADESCKMSGKENERSKQAGQRGQRARRVSTTSQRDEARFTFDWRCHRLGNCGGLGDRNGLGGWHCLGVLDGRRLGLDRGLGLFEFGTLLGRRTVFGLWRRVLTETREGEHMSDSLSRRSRSPGAASRHRYKGAKCVCLLGFRLLRQSGLDHWHRG